MNKYILTLTISFLFFCGNAQQAELLYNHLSLQEAISTYEGKLKEDPNDGESIYNLANAYRLNNESVKAEIWFSKAVKKSQNPKAKFYYAQMLLMNGKPSKAKLWFSNYKLNVSGKEAQHIDDFISYCYLLETDQIKDKYFQINKAFFNSDKLDFSPSYFGEEIVFVSNRKESEGTKSNLDAWTDEKYTDLYVVSPEKGYEIKPFSKKVNSGLHESSGTFSKDLNTFYFTRSNQIKGKSENDEESNVRLQIMKTSKLEEGWDNPIKLEFNNDNFSFCHPSLSADEQMMIFASDQPGGFGGMDLYIVKSVGGEWGVPENLGEKINTSGNEVFPYIDKNNNLYFSSNFHAGFGGLDIFKSLKINKKWSKPKNVGSPINSVKDDFGVITQDNFQTGYFSSNRIGNDEIYSFKNKSKSFIQGLVMNCETGKTIKDADVTIYKNDIVFKSLKSDSNGIFSFEVDRSIGELKAEASKDFYSTSKVCPGFQNFDTEYGDVDLSLTLLKQINDDTKLSLCGKVINKGCNYLLDAVKINVINICNGEEFEVVSNKNGKFSFPITKNCKYKIKAEKGYFKTFEKIIVTDSTMKNCFDLDIEMNSTIDLRDPKLGYINGVNKVLLREGTVVDLYNIYFDFDKYSLRNDAYEELEWVRNILTKYPNMKVEISAHTDSRSTKAYNLQLSQNRAKSVTNYLVNHGVSPSRLVTKGYGESRLKNKCGDNIFWCNEIQHQRNRRVEFKIISFEGEAIESKEWKTYKIK